VLTSRFRKASLTPAILLLLGACAGGWRDWAFVQSVGGMALGTPYQTPEGVMIPVRVDVSGLQTITTPPTTMSSGLALKEIRVRRAGSNLLLALRTRVAGEGTSSSPKGDVLLGKLEAGRYRVQYAEPKGGAVDLAELLVTASDQARGGSVRLVGYWVGYQKLSAPLESDLDELRRRSGWVDAQVRSRYPGAALSGRAPDLDLLQRLIDDGAFRVPETAHWQSVGLALGNVLVNEAGLHWVVVEDRHGRDLALKFGDSSVLVFPLTMISKRVERGERPDVRQLFDTVRKELPNIVKRSDPKPG
jgi:hypothetical protein